MKKLLGAVFGILLFAFGAAAQTAPATQTWSVNTSAITLPGNHQTFVGVDSGITFTPAPNLDLLDRNLVQTGSGFGYFAGGFNYRFPALSVGLNNKSPNVNFLRLQFGITGSFGVDRIQLPRNAIAQHYGFTAGAFANYQLTKGGKWTLAVKAEYVQFPGLPTHAAISINPAFHF